MLFPLLTFILSSPALQLFSAIVTYFVVLVQFDVGGGGALTNGGGHGGGAATLALAQHIIHTQ